MKELSERAIFGEISACVNSGKALSGLTIAIGKAGTELLKTKTDTATGRA